MNDDAIKKAFLDALAQGESGGDYSILFGGSHFDGYGSFPQWAGLQGPAGISHAAGKYQFEPATWREVSGRLNLGDFSPASQDAGAWDLASRVYASRTGRDLAQDLAQGATSQVAPALHSTWTSLSSATFPQRFSSRLPQLPGASEPRRDVPVTQVEPVPQTPTPQPFFLSGHVTTMASAGVSYAIVVTACWLFSLDHIVVPEVVQDGWVVMVTAFGGWFLSKHGEDVAS